jgi:hypothetical protein
MDRFIGPHTATMMIARVWRLIEAGRMDCMLETETTKLDGKSMETSEDVDVLTLAYGYASFEDGRGIKELRRVNKAPKKDWMYSRRLVTLRFPLALRYCP